MKIMSGFKLPLDYVVQSVNDLLQNPTNFFPFSVANVYFFFENTLA